MSDTYIHKAGFFKRLAGVVSLLTDGDVLDIPVPPKVQTAIDNVTVPIAPRKVFVDAVYTDNAFPYFADWTKAKAAILALTLAPSPTYPVSVYLGSAADGTPISIGTDTPASLAALGIYAYTQKDLLALIGNGGGGALLKTNGTNNTLQTVLNLIAGTGMTLTPDENGGVTLISIAPKGDQGPAGSTYAIVNVTYAELTTLISNSGLAPGQDYLITDYQTVHTIYGTGDIYTADIEPLLVRAATETTLYKEALSAAYPEDEIFYCLTNDQTAVPGCTKGFIYHRKDTRVNIEIQNDWRNVKYRWWALAPVAWSDETTYAQGDIVGDVSGNIYLSIKNANTNNAVADTAWWYQLSNIVAGNYVSPIPGGLNILNTVIPVNPDDYIDRVLIPETTDVVGVVQSSLIDPDSWIVDNIICLCGYIGSVCRDINLGVGATYFYVHDNSFAINLSSSDYIYLFGSCMFVNLPFGYNIVLNSPSNISAGNCRNIFANNCQNVKIEMNANNITILEGSDIVIGNSCNILWLPQYIDTLEIKSGVISLDLSAVDIITQGMHKTISLNASGSPVLSYISDANILTIEALS